MFASNYRCDKLGEAFSMVEGMSEKVSPARKHAVQARSGMKGDIERCVRELKRVVIGRGVELLGEMKVDYCAVEEMGRLLGWVEGVVGVWSDFCG
jgi:hypothetical protein